MILQQKQITYSIECIAFLKALRPFRAADHARVNFLPERKAIIASSISSPIA